MAEHNNLGIKGEQVAADYMHKNGYKIISRNWRFKHKEIDIIALHNDYLVVVEVKTRTSSEWEHPRDSITPSKIRFLVHATESFVLQNSIDQKIRFDVISVLLCQDGKWKVEHIENAFTSQIE